MYFSIHEQRKLVILIIHLCFEYDRDNFFIFTFYLVVVKMNGSSSGCILSNHSVSISFYIMDMESK